MIGQGCAYVRKHYEVPACIGRLVIAYGEPGVIQEDQGHYIGVVLDSDPKKRIRSHHPVDGIVYGEMADELPLKLWDVLMKRDATWLEVALYMDACHYVQQVWAVSRSQAKYRAYQEAADLFDDDPRAMLEFKVRRA